MEDTYGHTPPAKMFDQGDVYGVGYDAERATRRPLRLVIIGAGGVAQSKYIPAIQRLRALWEPVELVGISSLDARSGRNLERMLGGCRWYVDYAQMLQEVKPDGALICSPDTLHVEHALACIQADIPALVEKPLSRSLADARRLCQTAQERGTLLMAVANKRFSPPYRRARQLVDQGPVANPALFSGKFNLGYDYVDLFEAGTIHLFDLARFFMGEIRTVQAIGVNRYQRNKNTYPVDNAILTLEFVSGAIGTLVTISTALSLKPWERVEVYGEKAWLAVEDQYELRLYDSETGPTQSWKPVIPNTLLFDEEFGGYLGLVENFLQAIRGQEAPRVTGWDGYRALEVSVAAHLSLQRKTAVSLPLDPNALEDAAPPPEE